MYVYFTHEMIVVSELCIFIYIYLIRALGYHCSLFCSYDLRILAWICNIFYFFFFFHVWILIEYLCQIFPWGVFNVTAKLMQFIHSCSVSSSLYFVYATRIHNILPPLTWTLAPSIFRHFSRRQTWWPPSNSLLLSASFSLTPRRETRSSTHFLN